MHERYDAIYLQNVKRYGPRIALLVKAGSWWVASATRAGANQPWSTNVNEFAEILGKAGGMMERFENGLYVKQHGIAAVREHEQITQLQAHGYTIVLYEQREFALPGARRREFSVLGVFPPGERLPFVAEELDE